MLLEVLTSFSKFLSKFGFTFNKWIIISLAYKIKTMKISQINFKTNIYYYMMIIFVEKYF